MHSVSYKSAYDDGLWHQMPAIYTDSTTHSRPVQCDILDLPYAHVEYIVRIRIRVRGANDTEEMWSRYSSQSFRSGVRIPDAPPVTAAAGGFYVDDNNHVYVYWRELLKQKENGNGFKYLITSNSSRYVIESNDTLSE